MWDREPSYMGSAGKQTREEKIGGGIVHEASSELSQVIMRCRMASRT